MRAFLLGLAWIAMMSGIIPLAPAQDVEQPRQQELPGALQRDIDKAKEIRPLKKIEERETEIPEIPQPLENRELTAAERAHLDQVEQQYAAGIMSQTQYDAEKDNTLRRANIEF